MIFIKKIFFLIILFLCFNTLHINSNCDKNLLYDLDDFYNINYHTIYFIDTNTNELNNALNNLDIDVLSYIIDDKKYYYRSIDKLEEYLLNDMNIDDKSYYYYNGIKIDGISVLCSTNDLIKLNKLIDIY